MIKSLLFTGFCLICGSLIAQTIEYQDNSYASPRRNLGRHEELPARDNVIKNNKRFLNNFRPFRSFGRRTVFEEFFDEKMKAYERLKRQNSRKYKRISRLMKRPQYSDPLYFGHRVKPKKRKVKNRKWCKTCGITH